MASPEQRSVPFFNYPHVFTEFKDQFMSIIEDVGSRGAFILQKDVREFEAALAEYTGAKYAIAVANGTDALIIACRAAGIGAGDEVIFSSHTYVATAASIYFCNATPIPVECGSDHLLDPEVIEAAITSKTKAIMPTQLNGRTCNMDRIMAIADKHRLTVIEDAAQALGSRFKGRSAGTFGAAGTISFYPAKSLGSFGDAGAILTNDDGMYERMMLLRDHGRNEEGQVVAWGLNSRMDNLQAALLHFKLNRYPEMVERRRQLASLYQEELGGLSQLVLPPPPDADGDHFDIFQNYEIEADQRDELLPYLRERGVGTLIQWGGKAVHQIEELGLNRSLPATERLFERCVMLPLNTSLSDEDVRYVATTIKAFYG